MRALLMKDDGAGQSIGDLTINLKNRTVEVAGTRIHLTQREYQVLELLARHQGGLLSKATIMKHLYPHGNAPDSKIIDVFMCNLRRKLAAAGKGQNFIETVRGRGYVLRKPVEHGEKLSA